MTSRIPTYRAFRRLHTAVIGRGPISLGQMLKHLSDGRASIGEAAQRSRREQLLAELDTGQPSRLPLIALPIVDQLRWAATFSAIVANAMTGWPNSFGIIAPRRMKSVALKQPQPTGNGS